MTKRSFIMAKSFKKDLRKHYLHLIGEAWTEVSNCLLNGMPIPEKYKDHPLHGDKNGFRDCHIKPDLMLIYKIIDDVVELHYLDTHNEIFG